MMMAPTLMEFNFESHYCEAARWEAGLGRRSLLKAELGGGVTTLMHARLMHAVCSNFKARPRVNLFDGG